MHQEKICWPLGTRFDPAEEALCHRQAMAWVLNDTAPPTFPDRLRSGEVRYAYEVDAVSGLRVTPACSSRPRRRVEAVRWPTALEPWLTADLRAKALPPAWDNKCQTQAEPETSLSIVGLSNGEVIKRSRPDQPPVIHLELRGQRGPVYWLINGRQIAHRTTTQPLIHSLTETGRVDITVMDEQGRYDRISISVR